MIKGFSVKNMAIGLLTGTLVATNFHISGLPALDMVVYTAMVSVTAWIAVEAAVEELEIRYGKRREKRARKDR